MIRILRKRKRRSRRRRRSEDRLVAGRGLVALAITVGAGMWGYALVTIATRAF